MKNDSNNKKFIDIAYTTSFIKLNRRRLLLFIIIYNILMTLSHTIPPPAPHVADFNNHSGLALAFGFPIVAAIYTFLVSIVLVFSICLIVPYINEFKKTMISLAVFFGLLWFFGMFEALFIDETYKDLLIIAITDAIPAFIIVFLIAQYTQPISQAIKTSDITNNKSKYEFVTILTILITFTIGRLIGYYILNMSSRISDMNVGIIIWTSVMGLLIGAGYIMFREHIRLRFVLILFGTNWLMFNLFVPLLLNEPFLDFIGYRGILDVVSVFTGALSAEYIRKMVEVKK